MTPIELEALRAVRTAGGTESPRRSETVLEVLESQLGLGPAYAYPLLLDPRRVVQALLDDNRDVGKPSAPTGTITGQSSKDMAALLAGRRARLVLGSIFTTDLGAPVRS
ncbi:MAG: hypothetical protein ABI692_01115 [Terracoccus sp.]